jgi:hypothetical protein
MLLKVVRNIKLGRPFASHTGFAVPMYSMDVEDIDTVEDEIKTFFDSIGRKGSKHLDLGRLTDFVSTTFLDRQVFLDEDNDYDFAVARTVEAVKDYCAENSETQDVSLEQALVLLQFATVFDVQDL